MIPIIIFSIALILIISMLWYRISQIQRGAITPKVIIENSSKKLSADILVLQEKGLDYSQKYGQTLRRYSHIVILHLLKIGIAVMNFVTKKSKIIFLKLLQKIKAAGNQNGSSNGKPNVQKREPSAFLNDIAEYKDKLRKAEETKERE